MIWKYLNNKDFVLALLSILMVLTGCTFYDGDAMDGYMGSDDPCFLTVRNDSGTPSAYSSSDGKHWNQVSVVPLEEVKVLAYGEGLFVAGGDPAGTSNDLIAYSPDGINWNTAITWNGPETPENKDFIRAMDYNNGTFTCSFNDDSAGTSGIDKFYYSRNGIDWHAGNGSTSAAVIAIKYGGDKFAMLATQELRVSSDGINWSGNIWNKPSVYVFTAAYGNTIFIVGGDNNFTNGFIAASDDGYTYTDNLIPGNTLGIIVDIYYGNRRFVAIERNGYTYVSDNGFVWDGPFQIKDAIGKTMCRIIYGNNLFVAVGTGGIYYSKDGIHWSGNAAPGGIGSFIDIVYRP